MQKGGASGVPILLECTTVQKLWMDGEKASPAHQRPGF